MRTTKRNKYLSAPRGPRKDKGVARGPRRSRDIASIDELRKRHFYCIPLGEVQQHVAQGRIPMYFDKPLLYAPACDHPEDKVCAAPSVSTESINRKLSEDDAT